jgi:hypothetical protein
LKPSPSKPFIDFWIKSSKLTLYKRSSDFDRYFPTSLLHWILDVGFREDDSRATQGYSAENLAVIRHLAVNLLTQEKTAKGGTRSKRLKAGWDDHYLTKVLSHSSKPPSKPSRKL